MHGPQIGLPPAACAVATGRRRHAPAASQCPNPSDLDVNVGSTVFCITYTSSVQRNHGMHVCPNGRGAATVAQRRVEQAQGCWLLRAATTFSMAK